MTTRTPNPLHGRIRCDRDQHQRIEQAVLLACEKQATEDDRIIYAEQLQAIEDDLRRFAESAEADPLAYFARERWDRRPYDAQRYADSLDKMHGEITAQAAVGVPANLIGYWRW